MMYAPAGFIWSIACSFNVWAAYAHHAPFNAAVAAFSGLVAIFAFIMAAK